MDEKNSYADSGRYLAYCQDTDEKTKLHECIREDLIPRPASILDLGCGNGINTAFLADYFSNSSVDAIERSPAQFDYAITHNNRKNTTYILNSFEDFHTDKKYDFILASHVLQYIDSNLESFVRKAISMLSSNAELWFVQQTRYGMAQIISHQRPYLANPRFGNWKTFEDYLPIIEDTLKKGFQIEISHLNSSFKQIDFANPSEEDKLRLEFIFCLTNTFDEQSLEFKSNLAKLDLGNEERISHPNGIMKIRRTK
jgi:SAM-dependent methyltransferase